MSFAVADFEDSTTRFLASVAEHGYVYPITVSPPPEGWQLRLAEKFDKGAGFYRRDRKWTWLLCQDEKPRLVLVFKDENDAFHAKMML